MLPCLECGNDFIPARTDSYDDRFCSKWCEKKWHDKNYKDSDIHVDI